MKLITIAAAIAAVASATAAVLTLKFTYTQSDNYKTYYSYIEVKDFEESDAKLGNSKHCMYFLGSISDGAKLASILKREPGPIRVELKQRDEENYMVCMAGLDAAVELDFDTGVGLPVELETETIAKLSHFVFRVLNIHNKITEFSLGEFADSAQLNSYVVRKVYKAEAIVGLVGALCDKTKFNLRGYRLMLEGMSKHTPGGLCSRVLAKPGKAPKARSRLNILG